jgi:NitT/TauT family transport system permease protein
MRIGVSLALLGTLVGELFASDRGIGFMLIQSVEHTDVPTVMALTLLLFLVAVAGGSIMLHVDRRLRREG